MWLASVGQQDYDDDDEEQPSSCRDAEDGGKGEQAVGPNVNLPWRDVESSYLDLDNNSSYISKACWKCSHDKRKQSLIRKIVVEELNLQTQQRCGPFFPEQLPFEEDFLKVPGTPAFLFTALFSLFARAPVNNSGGQHAVIGNLPDHEWQTMTGSQRLTWKPVGDPQKHSDVTDEHWPTDSDPHPRRQPIRSTDGHEKPNPALSDWPGLCAARWGSEARRVAECRRRWGSRACRRSAPCNSAGLHRTQTAPGYVPETVREGIQKTAEK